MHSSSNRDRRRRPGRGLALSFIVAASTAGMSGCGGGQATAPVAPIVAPRPAPPRDVAPADIPPAIAAAAVGSDAREAHDSAVDALALALFGAPGWAEALAVGVHDLARDHREETAVAGGVRVELALGRDRVAEILAEAEQRRWQPSAPPPLVEPIARAAAVHLAALVCARRHALLQEECSAEPTDAVDAEVRQLADTVRLRSYYAGGVPVTRNSRPLRPVTVVVERRAGSAWSPLAGVPVALIAPQGGGEPGGHGVVLSDDNGLVRFELPQQAAWPAGLRVAVSRPALLGPLAELWPDHPLAIPGREISPGRWIAIATERVQGLPAGEDVFADQLRRVLGRSEAVAPDLARVLESASPEALAGRLPALADQWQGRVDTLFLIEVDSIYASRAGANRLWYKAEARVRVFNLWTGEAAASLEDSATVSGIGDQRADRAARAELAEKVATRLLELSL